MHQYIINKSFLSGELSIPPSKSHTLRALLFGALAEGKSIVRHYLHSSDTMRMIDACRLLGATVEVFPDKIEIKGISGVIPPLQGIIDAGNSGIILRFLTAICALSTGEVKVTGDSSICSNRPMNSLLQALTMLGAKIHFLGKQGYAPFTIQGPLKGGKVTVDGADSQPVSALLIAAAFAAKPIEIKVTRPGEIPYIQMTLKWLDDLNIPYEKEGYELFRLKGSARPSGFDYTVPGDLSTAAFPLAAALITKSELLIKNIDLNDSQGDKELVEVFMKMGAIFEVDSLLKTIKVKKSVSLRGLTLDINNYIDALPILAVVGCFASGETHLLNASNARHKECDRIRAIKEELGRMGASIVEKRDGLLVKHSQLKPGTLNSHQDHRIAMALSVAAMGVNGETTLSPIDCVAKTYAHFAKDFIALGANFKTQ